MKTLNATVVLPIEVGVPCSPTDNPDYLHQMLLKAAANQILEETGIGENYRSWLMDNLVIHECPEKPELAD